MRNLERESRLVEIFTNHFDLTIEIHSDAADEDIIGDTYYEVNESFYLYPRLRTETRKSIGREVTVEVIEWHVYGLNIIPATYWEPEECDECKISIENDLTRAFKKVLLLEYNAKIDNILLNEPLEV